MASFQLKPKLSSLAMKLAYSLIVTLIVLAITAVVVMLVYTFALGHAIVIFDVMGPAAFFGLLIFLFTFFTIFFEKCIDSLIN